MGEFLLALSFFVGLFSLISAISEFIDSFSIRAPRERSFSEIRTTSQQHANIIAPAIAALISGFLISISASSFFNYLSSPSAGPLLFLDLNKNIVIGLSSFLLAILSLYIILGLALKGTGDPSELAKEPASIIAAAREHFARPGQASLSIETLRENLEHWRSNLVRHSINKRVKFPKGAPGDSKVYSEPEKQLFEALQKSSNHEGEPSGFSRLKTKTKDSFSIYFWAARAYKWRIIPLIAGPILGIAGLTAITQSRLSDPEIESYTKNDWIILAIFTALFVIFPVISSLLYCITRGNRARKWHTLYIELHQTAEATLLKAMVEKQRIETESEQLEKLKSIIEAASDRNQSAQHQTALLAKLGRFELIRRENTPDQSTDQTI